MKDFWLDLIQNTTSTTTPTTTTTTTVTQKPDFWLDLISTTTTIKPTTTTTIKPLIVGNQRLNESSEFFDLNALLSGKQTGGHKQERQVPTTVPSRRLNNEGFVDSSNGNGRVNLNTAGNNFNQFVFDEGANQNKNNNFRGNGNNGRGKNNGRVQVNGWNQNNGRVPVNGWNQNNGRVQGNGWNQNNGRVQGNNWNQNNGRVPGNGWDRGNQNNGRGRPGMGNQNRGFSFPNSSARPNQSNVRPNQANTRPNQANVRPNQFIEQNVLTNQRPGTPVNTFVEQNQRPQNMNSNPTDSNINQSINVNDNEQTHIENLIKDVFDTSIQTNKKLEVPGSTQENMAEANLEKSIANIFNLSPQQTNTPNTQIQQVNFQNNGHQLVAENSNPVATWLAPQDTTAHATVQFPVNQQQQQHLLTFQNPQIAGNYEIIPVVDHQANNNDLETAPSSNFIQQPVVVETWSNAPVAPQAQEFNPVQVVYENLLNSGMDIVKSNEMQILPQPQVVVFQPAPFQGQQQFIQQPQQGQVFFQQPLAQHPPFRQQLIDQPQQSESFIKEPRSTSTTAVQKPENGLMPNIQSPPAHALDPFKPFEFRPPPENEITFADDNNALRCDHNYQYRPQAY